MTKERNGKIADTLLQGLGSGAEPDEIATLFAEDLVFEIQGHDEALPWIGRKIGRQALVDFVRDQRALTEPLAFDVEDVLASDSRAVVVGALRTRIKATGKVIETQFALVLTIKGDVVTRFQMLEDSYGVAQAAQ